MNQKHEQAVEALVSQFAGREYTQIDIDQATARYLRTHRAFGDVREMVSEVLSLANAVRERLDASEVV
jgi:hypothetical protein